MATTMVSVIRENSGGDDKMEIMLVLHNLRSAGNVGSILRTAEGFGVRRVLFSGYTPRLHDARQLPHLRAKLDKQIAKTALGADQWLSLESSEDLPQTLRELKAAGWCLAGLENNLTDPAEQAKLVVLPEFRGPLERLVLVLGEEVHGIAPDVRAQLDYFLEIPMRGHKESFNVSVAAGIALYALCETGR